MSRMDKSKLHEMSSMNAFFVPHKEVIVWHCLTELRKFDGDSVEPSDMYDFVSIEGNLLTFGGASALWERLTETSPVITPFNSSSAIGVGDSSTASTQVMNDLVATTNKFRKVMDGTYPLHTDGTVDGSDDCVFRSTFATGEANYAWNEWAIFNNVSAGRMLNRRVEALGTKTSAATWQLTLTLSLGGGA